MFDVVLLREVPKRCDERFAVVRDDFDECAPLAQYVLEDPVADGLCGFFPECAEFWVAGEGALALHNEREAGGAREVHGVHVHFCEEGCGCCDDRRY